MAAHERPGPRPVHGSVPRRVGVDSTGRCRPPQRRSTSGHRATRPIVDRRCGGISAWRRVGVCGRRAAGRRDVGLASRPVRQTSRGRSLGWSLGVSPRRQETRRGWRETGLGRSLGVSAGPQPRSRRAAASRRRGPRPDLRRHSLVPNIGNQICRYLVVDIRPAVVPNIDNQISSSQTASWCGGVGVGVDPVVNYILGRCRCRPGPTSTQSVSVSTRPVSTRS